MYILDERSCIFVNYVNICLYVYDKMMCNDKMIKNNDKMTC